MKTKFRLVYLLAAFILVSFQDHSQPVKLSQKSDMIRKANNLVTEYNKGAALRQR